MNDIIDKWDWNISKDELFKLYKQKELEIENLRKDKNIYLIAFRLIGHSYSKDIENCLDKACQLVNVHGYIKALRMTRNLNDY